VLFAYRFEVNRYQRALRGLEQPLRVAHLSDLHIGFWMQSGSVRRWVEATNATDPDLVVITGDMTDSSRHEQVVPHLGELANLRSRLGTFAVWGNHDYRFNGYQTKAPTTQGSNWLREALGGPPKVPMHAPEELGQRLEQNGVRLLVNQGVQLRPDFYLAGVDDHWHGEPDVERAVSARANNPATLLICHNPDFLYKVPTSVDLTLCGHTHGGQFKFPGYGAVFTSSQYGQKFAEGWIDEPTKGFVSRGLGVASVPIRLSCVAEVVVHEFYPPQVTPA
jgi:uncharacterized protein